MFGRSRFCLLAILILAPHSLSSQTDRAQRAPQVAPYVTPDIAPRIPHIISPTSPRQFPILPRLPVSPTGTAGLAEIARAAGTIFSGTVTQIERRPATPGQTVETVVITFHIENAIRGVTPGEDLSISQWIGLWSSGERYHVGERLLLFLYPRSKLGLTSCVAGPMGRFNIDAWGRVLLSAPQLSVFRTRSRPWWEVACTLQRLRLGGAACQ